jgi:hypothetical protein
LSSSYFAAICKEFGGLQRLESLAPLIRERPTGPSIDARIALELGWLRPYAAWRDGNKLVTGVVTTDYGESYPLYAPWFRHSPRNWWDDGAVICNRVPNIPKYTSEPSAALLTIPGMQTQVSSVEITQRGGLWSVRVSGQVNDDLLGVCDPGVESVAKAIVLAGIDCRLRGFRESGPAADSSQK